MRADIMNYNMLTPVRKEIYTSTIVDPNSTIYLDHKGEIIEELCTLEIESTDHLTERELAEILIPDISTKPLSDEEVNSIIR